MACPWISDERRVSLINNRLLSVCFSIGCPLAIPTIIYHRPFHSPSLSIRCLLPTALPVRRTAPLSITTRPRVFITWRVHWTDLFLHSTDLFLHWTDQNQSELSDPQRFHQTIASILFHAMTLRLFVRPSVCVSVSQVPVCLPWLCRWLNFMGERKQLVKLCLG